MAVLTFAGNLKIGEINMENIFLFPGQGAQAQGMAIDFCDNSAKAKEIVTKMSEICNEDIYSLLKDTDAQELSRSDKSQLSIAAAELICAEVLKEKGIMPSACAGFSLGEFPALCVAGILSFEDTMKLVKRRGQIFQAVCEEISGAGMSAIIGLTPEQVSGLLKDYNDPKAANAVFATNLNSPKQTVVSGTMEGLKVCEKLCTEAGARRVVPLKVAGPFHSPLMQKAADAFVEELNKVEFKDPVITCFSNVTGKAFASGEEAKQNACNHIIKPVRWTEEEAAMAAFIDAKGSCRLLEAGPGKVLSGLWRDSGYAEKAECLPVGTLEAVNNL